MAGFIELKPGDWQLMDDIGRVMLTVENEASVLRVYHRDGEKILQCCICGFPLPPLLLRRELLSQLEGTEAALAE